MIEWRLLVAIQIARVECRLGLVPLTKQIEQLQVHSTNSTTKVSLQWSLITRRIWE